MKPWQIRLLTVCIGTLCAAGISPDRAPSPPAAPAPTEAAVRLLPDSLAPLLPAGDVPEFGHTPAATRPQGATPGQVVLICAATAGVLTSWAFGLVAWGGHTLTWSIFAQALGAAAVGGLIIALGILFTLWLMQNSFLGKWLDNLWERLAHRFIPKPRRGIDILFLWPVMLVGLFITFFVWMFLVGILFISFTLLFGMIGAIVSMLIMGYTVSFLGVLAILGAMLTFFLFI
ncbi:MAG: hypothetical protein KF690_03005 [Bacteroidetes bacterium]|nr:hypothetical protein [Bacteroidota bacterium]